MVSGGKSEIIFKNLIIGFNFGRFKYSIEYLNIGSK